ncbi:MAG TPA: cell division protein ZapD [Gammaproteobacteria bacterium]
MAKPATQFTPQAAEARVLKFEQPLNERMRTFLRVEFLYDQMLYHAEDPTDYGSRAAVAALLELVTILGRGDVRSDALKELDRHGENLARYRSQPGVDPVRLAGLMTKVEQLRKRLQEAGSQLLNPLKECDFLTTVRHRSAIPGGTCMFDVPDYGYWLHLPAEVRGQHLREWANHVKPLCEAVSEVLWLTREGTEPVERVAAGGLYHHNLGRDEQANLVRVLLPANAGIFPEVSAGQHRFTVRFVRWRGVETRPVQVTEDVRFLLSLC